VTTQASLSAGACCAANGRGYPAGPTGLSGPTGTRASPTLRPAISPVAAQQSSDGDQPHIPRMRTQAGKLSVGPSRHKQRTHSRSSDHWGRSFGTIKATDRTTGADARHAEFGLAPQS